MAGWHHDNANWRPRYCAVCGIQFKPFSGVHKFCSPQCKGKWKYITGVFSTENQYKEISGNWRRYFSRLCCRSHKRIDLRVEDLLEILNSQNYKCALSGVELTCKLEKGTKFKTNASIDRLEAGGPYIKENIQLVCSALNSWRADTDKDEFIWWCKQVAKYQGEGEQS
jgi:hypothetical protein